MKNELVSIIVPIYKVEQYLKECIDSIINQTYKNLEIILVDDGSPDNCGKICDEYEKKDNRIKVIHKENGGLSSARNAGLDVARGDYISFIDSDDYVSNEFIEKLYLLCKKNNADISECNFVRFIDSKEVKLEINNNTFLYSSEEMQERIYSTEASRTVIVCNKLYKKYIYDSLRFPLGKINEDEFITYKAFYNCKEKIAVTSESLYYYRYNENSIMGKKYNIRRLDVLTAFRERKEFYKKNNNKGLFEKTVIKYQYYLIESFIMTKKYIEKPQEYLNNILYDAKKNFRDYKEISEINLKEKIKMKLFLLVPNLYYFLIMKKRSLNIKF